MREHLASLVDDFRANPHETAVVAHRGVRRYRTTYGELAQLAGRFSAELARRGIGPGERVVLWGANSAEWIAVFFGCLLRGVLAVPLDAAGSAEFAARVIADTKPRLVVADPKLLKALGKGTKEAGHNTPLRCDALPLSTIAQHLPMEPLFGIDPAVTLDAPFQIVFTSGTTAEPRGIVHTHRNILVTLDPIECEIAKYRRYERPVHPLRFLHSLPLSHVFGQFMGLWTPALLATEVHFADQLDPARIAEVIRRDRISVLIAVPRVLHLLRAHLLSRVPSLAAKLESAPAAVGGGAAAILKKWWRFRRVHRELGWRFWAIISGGATLPADLEAFYNKVGLALIQGYGMTETAALVTLNHPFHIAPGTIGRTLPGREVKISGDGEILVRGAMLSGATWQHGALREREGEWLATGDLAEENGHGELRFLGRKGDVIVTAAGLNIHPADLESALAAQPGIRAAAVVGCSFAAGPEPVAVVLTALDDAELDAAVTAANHTLAGFQQMRRVLRWPEPQLPYTSAGKLIRRKVAEWACAVLSEGTPVAAANGRKDALLTSIAEITGEAVAVADDTGHLRLSEDLHMDSLGRVQLQSALEERFSIDVDDDAIATVGTVGELRALLQRDAIGTSPVGVATGPATSRVVRDDRVEQGKYGDRRHGGAEEAAGPSTARSADPLRPARDDRPVERDEHLYPRWPWSWPVRAMRLAFLELVTRPLVWLLVKPRVVYEPGAREALNALIDAGNREKEPLVLIANHITAYDGALVLYALPGTLRRHVAAAMSGEMLLDYRRMRNQGNAVLNLIAPAAYWLVTALFNVFPLPQGRGFRRSFAHAGEAMDRGYSVLIFPEGIRSRSGHMNAFRSGIGLLAEQTQTPIVPIALAGVYGLVAERDRSKSAPGGRWLHAGRIEVRIGAPIPISQQDFANSAALASSLESTFRALLT
jgi:long-chain acyl-CoA synthetase